MLENGHEELPIDLADGGTHRFKFVNELAEKGHKHLVAYVHQFGEAGTMGQMDCVYSYWVTRRDEGFGAQGLAALRDLVPVLGLAIKTAAQADITKTLGRVYLGRDTAEQVLRGRIARGVTERINTVLWFSDLRGSTAISESIEPGEIIPFLNDYAQASIGRSVDREWLMSSAFRAGLDAAGRNYLVSTGRYALRGIGRAQDLYTLDPDIAADEVVAGKYERYLAG